MYILSILGQSWDGGITILADIRGAGKEMGLTQGALQCCLDISTVPVIWEHERVRPFHQAVLPL